MDSLEEILIDQLNAEIRRQDKKHGRIGGDSDYGRARLGIACVQDEVDEALEAWRDDKKRAADDLPALGRFFDTKAELMQVAAVAIRVIRDIRDAKVES